jgi:hypothetical protein
MNEYAWVSLVSMAGWLVLSVSAFRSYRVGAKKIVTMTLTWLAIFLLVTALFATVGA